MQKYFLWSDNPYSFPSVHICISRVTFDCFVGDRPAALQTCGGSRRNLSHFDMGDLDTVHWLNGGYRESLFIKIFLIFNLNSFFIKFIF